MRLLTARLEIVAATAQMACADLIDSKLFSSVLDVRVPRDWPPSEFADAQSIFARYLERSPDLSGWLHWYWIVRDDRVLIGNGGFGGRPDISGKIEIGFSVVDSYHNLGYATEAVQAMLKWAAAQDGVKKIVAATAPDNHASRRVLSKCGFASKSTHEDAETIEYELRVEKE